MDELKANFIEYLEKQADIAMDILVEHLEKKNIKGNIIKQINKNVDIPMIGEKTEKKVYDAVYKITLNAIRGIEFNDDDDNIENT